MNRPLFATPVAILASFISTPAMSATYTAVVSQIQPNHETADCFFFRLSGVTGIVPTSPGDWFAIPRDSSGAMEAFAVLLASRTKGNLAVTVQTTDAMACGYAQAVSVIM